MNQIIAIGGGGFSPGPKSIDRYILSQSNCATPSVCFLPTASGDADIHVARFYETYCTLPCKPTHVPLFRRTPDLRKVLLSQNIIFVGGGNTKSMIAVWKEWGLPEILQEALSQGIILSGTSAGAICWFAQGITDSWAGALYTLDCLNFLPGSCCPHYDGEVDRRPSYLDMVRTGKAQAGIALCDNAAAHFKNGSLNRVVVVTEKAKAFRVFAESGEVKEEALPAELL